MKRKAPFGVVASEPLATLISCVVQGRKPEMPAFVRGGEEGPLVELLGTNGEDAEQSWLNGSKQPGKIDPVTEAEVPTRGGGRRPQGGRR